MMGPFFKVRLNFFFFVCLFLFLWSFLFVIYYKTRR